MKKNDFNYETIEKIVKTAMERSLPVESFSNQIRIMYETGFKYIEIRILNNNRIEINNYQIGGIIIIKLSDKEINKYLVLQDEVGEYSESKMLDFLENFLNNSEESNQEQTIDNLD